MIRSLKSNSLLIALVAFAGACKEPVPEFVRELVASHPEREIRAIWRYRFNGETVYYVQHGCCDQYNDLYDGSGKHICSPDGGMTGGGDGQCPTFWTNAKRRVVVWEVGQYTE
jgi:uncharacterized protein DUF6970